MKCSVNENATRKLVNGWLVAKHSDMVRNISENVVRCIYMLFAGWEVNIFDCFLSKNLIFVNGDKQCSDFGEKY